MPPLTLQFIQLAMYNILLRLLGDFGSHIPYRVFAPGPHWGTSVSQTSGRAPSAPDF